MELTHTAPAANPVLPAQRALDHLRECHIALTDATRLSTSHLTVLETTVRDLSDTLTEIASATATHIRRSTIP